MLRSACPRGTVIPMSSIGHNTPWLDAVDLDALTALRRDLHRAPEVSGEEAGTAARIAAELGALGPDRIVTGLGGHGVAAVWAGAEPGLRVLIRAELDALPITETGTPDWASDHPGTGHLCGHDGHMALVTGLGRILSRQRPRRGEVVLMYQPAEENGAGAAAVTADPRYGTLAPDWAFAIHNMPALPRGTAAVHADVMTCPSAGMRITLAGRTAHASQPETGLAPTAALAALMPALQGLSRGVVQDAEFRLATVCHLRMGVRAFGIAPGEAELLVTLRARSDDGMAGLRAEAEAIVRQAAGALKVDIGYEDVFVTCRNTAVATDVALRALARAGLVNDPAMLPLRGSEDFGGFGGSGELAMIFLGAGPDVADLHNPDYDFPDAIIAPGVAVFAGIVDELLGLTGD
jgi:amidohydrolase